MAHLSFGRRANLVRLSNLSHIVDPDTFVSSSGEDVKILYKGIRKSPDSPLELVPDGKLSISEYINSFGCTTDMSYILARLKAGDDSVLFSNSSGYGDSTIFPSNPAEALQHINNATAYFDQLPDSVRNKFNNSFAEWISSAGSQDWLSKMCTTVDSSVPGNDSFSDSPTASSNSGSFSDKEVK